MQRGGLLKRKGVYDRKARKPPLNKVLKHACNFRQMLRLGFPEFPPKPLGTACMDIRFLLSKQIQACY